jgi:hypothetical protein
MDGFEKMFENYFSSLRRNRGFMSFGAVAAKEDIRKFWQESAKQRPCVCAVNDNGTVESICAAHDALIQQERKQTVDMLKEWHRHHGIMSDPKSMNYTMCIEEILLKLADRIEGE